MSSIFDKVTDRSNTGSIKWDKTGDFLGEPGVLPMWVADMDFEVPECIARSLKIRTEHPIFGYTYRTKSFYKSIVDWCRKRHGWEVKAEWIVFTPGVVPALNMSVLAFTKPGEKVIVQPPVYFPFFNAITDHGRVIVENPLVYENNRYSIDFVQLEKIASEGASMMFLCSPHNPLGLVWSKEELERIIAVCRKYNILLISDEIHNDLILYPHKHIPTQKIAGEIDTVTLMSPSKTFNIAGLATAYAIIPDASVRLKFKSEMSKLHLELGNLFGSVALEAAYSEGEEWLESLLEYLRSNRDYVVSFLEKELPQVRFVIPQGTYMIWLDFTKTGFSDQEVNDKLLRQARVGLSAGKTFGTGGEGFQRLNFACRRELLVEAMNRIRTAFSD